MRGESDNLCRKYGLSVIAPSARSGLDRRTLEAARQGGSWKVQLAITLDDLIDRVTSLPELQEELQKAGFNIERWKERDATVRKEGEEKAIRLSTLAKQFGWQYSMVGAAAAADGRRDRAAGAIRTGSIGRSK